MELFVQIYLLYVSVLSFIKNEGRQMRVLRWALISAAAVLVSCDPSPTSTEADKKRCMWETVDLDGIILFFFFL
jgi:hypothetical protein